MRASHLLVGASSAVVLLSLAACKVTITDGGGGTGGATSASTTTKASSTSTGTGTSTTVGSTSVSGTGGSSSSTGSGSMVDAKCNPVTGTPCNESLGETCDYSGETDPEFICYDGTNTGTLCNACDPVNGVYCENGLECLDVDGQETTFKCFRFCCTDADCDGTAGSCNTADLTGGTVGLCGTVDANFVATPICNTPATPPSNGACAN